MYVKTFQTKQYLLPRATIVLQQWQKKNAYFYLSHGVSHQKHARRSGYI